MVKPFKTFISEAEKTREEKLEAAKKLMAGNLPPGFKPAPEPRHVGPLPKRIVKREVK